MSSFVHLHVHSSFSPNWGLHTPLALCAAARDLGMKRLALTDRNGLYGLPDFIAAAKRTGIIPLVGSELINGRQRALLLVRDQAGYRNLCRLISALHNDSNFDLATTLTRRRSGLFVISDDRDLLTCLSQQDRHSLYVELSPGHTLEASRKLSEQLQLPPVATTRATFLHDDDHQLHRVLRSIAGNTTLSRLSDTDCANPEARLCSVQDLAARLPHCPEAVKNAAQIAAACKTDWEFRETIFPRYENLTDHRAASELTKRAKNGALWRYEALNDRIEKRLTKELDLIVHKGFAHYFLVVQELAGRSPRTCGRGSAAASLVAYCLGITHVDPLRYNLFFERFLNEGRQDPPDIDIDFPWDERDEILDFAFARYGRQRAAMVANQVGFKSRSALREIAKVFGLPAAEIKSITDRLASCWSPAKGVQALQNHPLFQDEDLHEDWQTIVALASRLNGQLRHLSQHCGGLVVVPDDMRCYVPVETSASGRPLIQWEKDQTEAAGLVKIDILGNRSLAVIRDALAAIQQYHGKNIDYRSWQPLSDDKTRALLSAGKTVGCFYIESPATRQLLQKMWRRQPLPGEDDLFEHLVMASSIIRPAANRFIREFVSRMRGKAWRHLHPDLMPILEETYGLAVYQEQITQISMALAGFSASEGDQLRKIVSKKDKHQRLSDFHQRFLSGGEERGIDKPVLEQVWEQILSFAGYSFCKPHSASYALVSCKSAWLKANYPAEFMAAVISNGGGYYSTLGYLSEARRLGLTVLPPDINQSDYPYRGCGKELQVGFLQIVSLTRQAIENLLKEREHHGPFADFADFLARLPQLCESDIRLLIKAGCFDQLEGADRRPQLVWLLLNRRQQVKPDSCGLFAEPPPDVPDLPPCERNILRAQELESLALPVSHHPLDHCRMAIARSGAVPAAALSRWIGRHVTLVGWWVTGKPIRTHEGRPMEFATFEDHSALFDATLFPAIYDRFCRLLAQPRPYLVKGLVEEEFGVISLNVKWLGFLQD
ncbi:DNA polymerase III subunit alpha [Syntrophotalea acetylenivorans]|uniref:DNA-directed DNA polymerase n=1 Tax=Syntrophotalea acetylenivorans TaxID=1842532 RepID=A0A1L3GLG7_9BACT|nr:DNA polymerase III subunit alpha [Syntrophotalea acetylenivorans]APG26783.1 DNA polymerase III subunit alpha [Syntrophotalea acetylenivorans]